MKTVVVERTIVEDEIRPHEPLARYRDLLAADVKQHLVPAATETLQCPSCDIPGVDPFLKFDLRYVECPSCGTIFCSPRPSDEVLARFYREAESIRYWRQAIQPATRESRRVKLVHPRVTWILDGIDRYKPEAASGISVGYHNDLLLPEFDRQSGGKKTLRVANPSASEELTNGEFENIPWWQLSVQADFIVACDMLDRCGDPGRFMRHLGECVLPEGLVFLTTTLASGMDVQILREFSSAIYPPDRLNLFTVEGLENMAESAGFKIEEFSTPGVLDVELLQRDASSSGFSLPPFIRYVLEKRDENTLSDLQDFLQQHRLSSFGRMVLRRSK